MAKPKERTMNATHQDRPSAKPNQLIHSSSPYLLQHAFNPVAWLPWGTDAFAAARQTDKPIFLSIGYSTCHWCHVMAHESFEDPEIARLINETFVPIKVDREERPDIDQVYMNVCQLLTGSGGWPLTIFLAPDQRPFFAATYIPRESRYRRAGLRELIPRIDWLWKNRREALVETADQLHAALNSSSSHAGNLPSRQLVERACLQLAGRFDEQHGGFGHAPKFPAPHNLLFLLGTGESSAGCDAWRMAGRTLNAMRLGGIYDHVGFGFHRYSTDPQWLVPHFEKMLYDQAMHALAYVDAYCALGREEFAVTAREIFTYVTRDMANPDGGFFAAEDADSDGEEGKFYVWTHAQILAALGDENGHLFSRLYNVQPDGNFADEATGQQRGTNILHLTRRLEDHADELGLSVSELQDRIAQALRHLLTIRNARPRPQRDTKILTDWNGLMIAALARGGRVLDEPEFVALAERTAAFVADRASGRDGRLFHCIRANAASVPGMLDDYAFLTWGLLELYEATFRPSHLRSALKLTRIMLAQFWDDERDGLFLAPHDGEQLIHRPKDAYDGALPSGNSVAMLNLLKLARITGDAELEDRALRIAQAFSGDMERTPLAYTAMISALDFTLGGPMEIVISGARRDPDTQQLLAAVYNNYLPHKVVLLRTPEAAGELASLAPFTQMLIPADGKAVAYLCRQQACYLPTASPEALAEALGKAAPR